MSSDNINTSPAAGLEIRYLIACPRSGSTLFMRVFGESNVCAITSRLMLTGSAAIGKQFIPDYTILHDPLHHQVFRRAVMEGKRILICKEELGNDTQKGECTYDMLPDPSDYSTVWPIFLIRDPIRVFDSWKEMGWTNMQSLIDCFNNLFRMLHQADSSAISCLLYEQLAGNPRREIEKVCARWGVPFTDTMLDFSKPFGSSFVLKSDNEKKIYCDSKPLGFFSTVEENSTIVKDVACHGLLSNDEKNAIEQAVGTHYISCWRDHAKRPPRHLKDVYGQVLRESTSNAFSDGKASHEYRRARFIAVADRFSISLDNHFVMHLLHIYEATLKESLELKSGALELLSTLKRLGKKIAIITEGPQDAQEWTVENLGLNGYIDFPATTNYFKVSKTEGLFTIVLQQLGIPPSEMAYVGDSKDRDMTPGIAEGLFCIHLSEKKNCDLEAYPPCINTLNKLTHVLQV
ncbi:hypothetical protein PG994_005376 [Apiospora phragmitis]|uniref:Uncharacterized protein n=1 Tax=Apiospora phragmitis TaxID=2905665 RepID=A0ABR1VC38_9PEZI